MSRFYGLAKMAAWVVMSCVSGLFRIFRIEFDLEIFAFEEGRTDGNFLV